MSDKTEIRQDLRANRLQLTDSQVKTCSKSIVKRLQNEIDWDSITSVHTFLPINKTNEINTWFLIEWLQTDKPDIDIHTWKQDKKGNYKSCKITPETKFKENDIGIPLPLNCQESSDEYDMVLVPMLGFDRQKHRIGYGGGIYDRFLSTQPEALKVGLTYQSSHIGKISTNPHDIALDIIITEKKTYS